MIHVIVPVGPGHEQLKDRALDSVRIAIETHSIAETKVRVIDDTKGEMGRSKARNMGIEDSDAEWLFFLDADDLMHPNCFRNAEEAMLGHDAVWGSIWELQGASNVMVQRYQVPTISSYRQLLNYSPFLTLQIGHFVRRSAVVPFDETMDTGEDWDYYLRLWRQYSCVKIDRPLMLNSRGAHSTGPRSATGQDWWASVGPQMEAAIAAFRE